MDRALQSILSWWEIAGAEVPEVKAAPRRKAPAAARDTAQPLSSAAPTPDSETPAPPVPAPSAELAASAKNLEELKTIMAGFNAGEISDHARQMVFARGNPKADIMVIGEAPGRDEDIQGKPFVGRSGKLLDKIFASIGLTEDELYITNVVNWRPPGDRNPRPAEIKLCLPFLLRHAEFINPKIIVLVGGISFSALTGGTGIMKNRGQWTSLKVGETDIPALPIYHPAFLLKQPALKKDVWHDMLALRARHATS